MRKDELQLRLEAQQLFLFLHDEVVSPFRVVAVGLIALLGIQPFAFLVDGKIAVMDFCRLMVEVDFLKQAAKLRLGGSRLVFRLEHFGILAFGGNAIAVVFPIVLDHVDEEQRQNLDAERAKAKLLVQMLLDGSPNHLPLDGILIDTANRFADSQGLFLIRQLQVFVTFAAADVIDPIPRIQRTLGNLLQIVARLNRNRLTGH